MIIALGTDHRGYSYKELIKQQLSAHYTMIDHGAYTDERTDYPAYAQAVVDSVLSKKADVGILLCGSGTGMAIVANRYKGIYAAVVWNPEIATAVKQDDNCNILVVPADFITQEQMMLSITAWLTARFKAGRYQQRLAQADQLGPYPQQSSQT